MTVTDILKLIDAGFTKDDILKLDADVRVVPDQGEAPKQEASQEDPKPTPATVQPEQQQAPAGVILSDDQFTKLMQRLNVQGASLDVPPESDLSTKLGDHFKDLMIGK